MKFIHIGCWNYQKFSDSDVEKSLNTFVNNHFEKKDFIVIAGDNYYPNIEEYDLNTIKWIDVDKFIDGLDSMPTEYQKYLLFGNNDINDKTIIDNNDTNKLIKMFKKHSGFESFKNITENTNEMKTCRLVDIELLYTQTLGKNYKIYNGVTSIIFEKNLIIMIDTNIYDSDIYDESVQCYKRILEKDYYKNLSLEELITEQNNEIKKIINENISNIKNIVIIGHHPICSMKTINSENGNTNECYFNNKLVDIFKCISQIIKNNNINITYLCSHTHLYQCCEVYINDIMIKQYICGCGGARLDNLSKDIVNKKDSNCEIIIKRNDIYFKIVESITCAFGYLVITLPKDDNDLKVEFIKAKEVSNINYEKKYEKYKQKYLLKCKNKN
jgi:hypothetical protein